MGTGAPTVREQYAYGALAIGALGAARAVAVIALTASVLLAPLSLGAAVLFFPPAVPLTYVALYAALITLAVLAFRPASAWTREMAQGGSDGALALSVCLFGVAVLVAVLMLRAPGQFIELMLVILACVLGALLCLIHAAARRRRMRAWLACLAIGLAGIAAAPLVAKVGVATRAAMLEGGRFCLMQKHQVVSVWDLSLWAMFEPRTFNGNNTHVTAVTPSRQYLWSHRLLSFLPEAPPGSDSGPFGHYPIWGTADSWDDCLRARAG